MIENSLTIFFVSDGTGITVETVGQSLLAQFNYLQFEKVTLPFIDTEQKALDIVERINLVSIKQPIAPIVLGSLINEDIRRILANSKSLFIDVLEPFIPLFEQHLKIAANKKVGIGHSLYNDPNYQRRINAVQFAMDSDDGNNASQYHLADAILLGISRTGKTPASLYLALQYGIMVVNYPLTEEDMDTNYLPLSLMPFRHKLFGLTVNPNWLANLRQQRQPNSKYASINQCEFESMFSVQLFKKYQIPYVDTTSMSIEELSSHVMSQMGIGRNIR